MPSGVELATAWVRLVPSADGIQGELANTLGPQAEKAGDSAGKRAGKSMSAGMKTALVAGAAIAVAGLVSVFQTGMAELKFGEQINAQTDQIIKNTGFTMATDQINDYTLALSKVSGVSEEDLQSAGNSVLKFGNLSEENFTKAVDTINNMGAAGKDVAATGELLGKALADPAAAAGLLRKSGVVLTDQQKEMIDTMITAGDTAGAQGVILDSLEGTYGGMAEATGGTLEGNINKLQNAWENMAGDIVSLVMPAVSGVVGVLQNVVGFLSENQGVVIAIAALIGGVLVTAFAAWAVSIWATTVALLANPVVWIIVAIIALIAIIVLLVLNWDTVVKWITEVWAGFISWITGVIDGFIGWWNGVWAGFASWITEVWSGFIGFIMGIWDGFNAWLFSVVLALVAWWTSTWADIGRIIQDVFANIGGFISGIWDGIVDGLRGAVNTVISLINGMIDGVNGIIGTVGAAIGLELSIPNIPMLATGGTITRAGSVIVGERGPELLNLPRGASVNPDISAGGSGRKVEININPAAGMSEETIGTIAADRLDFALRGA